MVRTETDRCPGVLAVHKAADGGLARVRLPGGLLTVAQFDVLRQAADELGDGRLELTSRGNVQVRGLTGDGPRELSQRLYDAGLLPSITHDRVRNILASPLSGLDSDSRYDVLPVATAVDHALCARRKLAELPGRFLFALDDGRGDLAGVRADVLVRALDDREAVLTLGSSGVRVTWSDAADVMIAAAKAFLKVRSGQEWRIAEVPDGEARILDRLGLEPTVEVPTATTTVDAGRHGDDALVVTVPLGSLGQEQAAVVADVADEIRLTPWRSMVLRVRSDPAERLDGVGLVTKPDSPWNGVTACAGRPGCAQALADVRADARRVTPRLPRHGQPVHWSGCDRRCGKPAGEFVDVLAVGNGYVIDGERMGLR
ncbi:precorrin-3B synthase [Kribbella turkmenica]|uniref:precorrin-3B synthase n=1 Tax=Kribbella turkmenica TaxID=2530375 RepID=UPI001F3BC3B6|nr:precorrin-3B synthase [Kribbella turkmenica]